MRVLWIDDGLQWKPAIFGRKSRYQIKENEPVVASPEPHPSPARPTRTARANKSAKRERRSRTASAPIVDINGKLLPSREISGVAVISQAEARKVLVMSYIQMLKLENQKLLSRIQEPSSRLVYYAVAEVQRLLDLVTGAHEPRPSHDGGAMD